MEVSIINACTLYLLAEKRPVKYLKVMVAHLKVSDNEKLCSGGNENVGEMKEGREWHLLSGKKKREGWWQQVNYLKEEI